MFDGMMSGMTGGGVWLLWTLVIVVLVLGAAALVKYPLTPSDGKARSSSKDTANGA